MKLLRMLKKGVREMTNASALSEKKPPLHTIWCKYSFFFLFLFQDTFKDQNQLEYLDLSHNSMSKLQPHFFSNMNRLLWLNISHNDVSEIHGRIFARNSLLRVLHMNNNKLTRYFFFSNNLYKCLDHSIFRFSYFG